LSNASSLVSWRSACSRGPPPPGVCAPRASAGQAWACPLFLAPGAAAVSGGQGSPQGCRAPARCAAPWRPEGRPRTLRGVPEDERRRSRFLLGSWARAAGWSWSSPRLRCVGAEQGLAVVAAEQEGEPVQVLAQLSGSVGRVADEGFQRDAEPVRVAGQPLADELQQLGELGRVYDVQPEFGHRGHRL